MPHTSKEGYQTSLKIALGKGVSVDSIIGMSMICPAKLSLDLSDDVMEAGALDTIPFPIIYKPTIRTMLDFSNVDEAELKSLCYFPISVMQQHVVECRSNTQSITNVHKIPKLCPSTQSVHHILLVRNLPGGVLSSEGAPSNRHRPSMGKKTNQDIVGTFSSSMETPLRRATCTRH
jgi:hypothetical protein